MRSVDFSGETKGVQRNGGQRRSHGFPASARGYQPCGGCGDLSVSSAGLAGHRPNRRECVSGPGLARSHRRCMPALGHSRPGRPAARGGPFERPCDTGRGAPGGGVPALRAGSGRPRRCPGPRGGLPDAARCRAGTANPGCPRRGGPADGSSPCGAAGLAGNGSFDRARGWRVLGPASADARFPGVLFQVATKSFDSDAGELPCSH